MPDFSTFRRLVQAAFLRVQTEL